MKKRLCYMLLMLCLVLVIVPTVVLADGADIFDSGEGTSDKPYTIATLAQLEAFRDSVNNDGKNYAGKFIKLTADIDMSEAYGEGKDDNGAYRSWTPIGVYTGRSGVQDNDGARPFNGTFDGDNHVITVYINNTANDQGLFAYVSEGGTVKNLGIDGKITGGNYVGGVTAHNYGTIEDCYNTGSISGKNAVGVVGWSSGTVENCYNTGSISGGYYVGGVVGYLSHGTVTNCYNTGSISGSEFVGGVVGYLSHGTVTNCYNTESISGSDAGGVVGGVVGFLYDGTVTNCYNTGSISGDERVGGVVGYSDHGTVTNCYYLDTSCKTGGIGNGNGTTNKLTLAEFKVESNFDGFDFTDTWVMSTFFGRPILQANLEIEIRGDGTSATTAFEIPDLATLEAFRNAVNGGNDFSNQFIKLTADIDMSEAYGEGKGDNGAYRSWTPIGVYTGRSGVQRSGVQDNDGARPFNGTFDGDNHVITVYINNTANDQGLFAYVSEGGTVKNLGIDGKITGGNYVGGVTAYNYGTIEDCYNAATVIGSYYVGGVVGYLSHGTVENCYNTGDISGRDAGGVVGYLYNGTATNCYNTGSISGSYVGGVVGYLNHGTVTNCYNTGSISGSNYVGGVVGCLFGEGTVENCYYLNTSEKGIGVGTDTTNKLTLAEFKVESNFDGFDFTDTWVMSTFFGRPILQANLEIEIRGDGTSATTAFEIPDLATLEAFRNAVNGGNDFSNQFIKLTADIDMSEAYGEGKGDNGAYRSWTPIGIWDSRPFNGTFDGDNHVIAVYIDTTANDQGLFAYVGEGGTVKNLGIDGKITGGNCVGGVTANNFGTIEDCYNTGKISGKSAGGVVGDLVEGTVSNCYNTGEIRGETYAGGVVGYLYDGTVENCYNIGSISEGNHAGGVVGYLYDGTVENCYNIGSISEGNRAGGVVGNLVEGTVSNCYNTGSISGSKFVGGVVGYLYDGTVENCYNTGEISDGNNTGGVVGYLSDGTVTNCYYLDTSCTTGDGTDTTTKKSGEAFASGEVAWLLQETEQVPVWGQTLTGNPDPSPVFVNENGSNVVYKVTFVVDDNSTVQYVNGGEITVDEPTKTGCSFSGWYTAETGGEQVTNITADITLYAQWTINARTITFDPNGGTVATTTATTDADGKLTSLPTPTRKNYNFLGWFTKDGAMITTDTVFGEHTTVYAHWQIKASALLPTWQEWELIDKIVAANKKKNEPVETEPVETEPEVTEPTETEPEVTEPVAEPWENPFADVSETDAFFEAVKFVFENGYMNGMSTDTFAPNESLTRGMLVTVLYRAAGSPVMDEANPFTDVADDAWYYNAVIWAKSIGLITGITETEFAPENEITREQLVTIFYRYANFLGYDVSVGEDTNILSYEDFADVAEYAIPALQWACGAGLIENADGNILPKDNATRALVAMVLLGFYA